MVYKLIFAENLFIHHSSTITRLEDYIILVVLGGTANIVTKEKSCN